MLSLFFGVSLSLSVYGQCDSDIAPSIINLLAGNSITVNNSWDESLTLPLLARGAAVYDAISSSTHPSPNLWYANTSFEAEWDDYAPESRAYAWKISTVPDEEPLGTGIYSWNFIYENETREAADQDFEHGLWYLHVVACDENYLAEPGSGQHFRFNVLDEIPGIYSDTHPEEPLSKYFNAEVIPVPKSKIWQKNVGDAEWTGRRHHTSVAYDNRLWVIGGMDAEENFCNDVWSSDDGVTWTQETASADWSARRHHTSVVFDNKMWVIGGFDGGYYGDVWSSSDGVNWTLETENPGWTARGAHSSVVFDDRMWVMGGDSNGFCNDVWSSSDGVNWTQITAAAEWDARYGLETVVFDNKIWLIGGNNGSVCKDIWFSSDGAFWTKNQEFSEVGIMHHKLAVFDNKIWIIGGYSNGEVFNGVAYSSDGLEWELAETEWGSRYGHTAVVFNKIWIMGGIDSEEYYYNDVWVSSNGREWTEATAAEWNARRHHTSVVFDDKMWIIGGYDGGYYNDVWASSDGMTWTQTTAAAEWSARAAHTSVVFDDKIWVMGGDSSGFCSDVWYSSNGKTWTQATEAAGWAPRYGHTSVVFGNKMWVMGGDNGSSLNDVWSSSDGVTWTQETTAAAWPGARFRSSVVFDNKMWVIGGYNGTYLNDVWYSSNGNFWTQATETAEWEARYEHSSVAFDNKIWVLGGYDSNENDNNDVWYSSDGETWLQESEAANWVARRRQTSVVFDNKIWVMGGTSNESYLSDVWCHHLFLPSLVGYRYLFDDLVDTIPDETNSTFIDTTETQISQDCFWPGNHWLHVLSIDSLGNESPTAHHKFVVNSETPLVLSMSHPDPSSTYGNRDPILFWTTERECTDFYYTLNQQMYTIPAMLPESLIGNIFMASNLYEGTFYLHVYGVDNSYSGCNIPTETAHFQINIRQALPPVANFSFDSPTGNVAFSWVDTDNFANGDPPYYYILNNDPEFVITPDGEGVTGTYTTERVYPRCDPGVWFFHILSADRHGNLSQQSLTALAVGLNDVLVVVSAPQPTSTLTGPVDYLVTYPGATNVLLSPADITVVSDPEGAVTCGSITIADTTKPTVKRVVLDQLSGEGAAYIQIAQGTAVYADDQEAGAIEYSQSFTVDTVPPEIAFSGPTPAVTAGTDVTYHLDYIGADLVSLTTNDITLIATDTAEAADIQISDAGLTSRIVTLSGIQGNGTLNIEIAAGTGQDNAGNLTPAATGTPIVVDTIAPTLEVTGPDPVLANNDATVVYTLLYDDNNPDTLMINLDEPPVTLVPDPEGTATGDISVHETESPLIWEIHVTNIQGDGDALLEIAAGTASDGATSTLGVVTESFTADNTAPNAPEVSGATPTNNNTPAWSWTSGGGGNGVYRHAFSDDEETTWTETTDEAYTPASPLADGNYTLYVQEHDDAGNWSASGSFEIAIDATPPGIDITGPNPTSTNFGPVTYTLNITDATGHP